MTHDEAGRGLLADIRANPADDFPRLVYADWLEECDTEESRARARFIRYQIETGQTMELRPRMDCVEEFEPHEVYKGATLATAKRHTTTVFRLPAPLAESARMIVQRGFVWSAQMPLQYWLRDGPRLASEHPVEVLELQQVSPSYIPAHQLPPRPRAENAVAWLMPTEDGRAVWVCAPEDSGLPATIWDLLDGEPHALDSGALVKLYGGRNRDDKNRRALLGLSRAALEWAHGVQCLRCNDTGSKGGLGGVMCVFCDAGTQNVIKAAGRMGMAHALRQNQRILDAVAGVSNR